MADINNFSSKYREKYGNPDSKIFLLGNSLGGLISSFVAAGDTEKLYSGICLAVPYFGLYDDEVLNKVRPMLEMMMKVRPD